MADTDGRLTELAKLIHAFTEYRFREDVIGTGEALAQAKKLLPHGQWYPWLKEQFDWTPRTAQRFLRVYNIFCPNATLRRAVSHLGNPNSSVPATLQRVPPLPFWATGARSRIDASAFYLLAERKVPHVLRCQAIEAANAGAYISKEDAEHMIWMWNRQTVVVKKRKALTGSR
jgi:hypothetical protein